MIPCGLWAQGSLRSYGGSGAFPLVILAVGPWAQEALGEGAVSGPPPHSPPSAVHTNPEEAQGPEMSRI